ncbi:hypothetical protein C5167_047010 [Papaver somniferum]|uniref:Uncharacterized protein n=2 Tax=Papaver somniferum TaxID=3469 RepID=A0A4Y7LGX2_PAPSO|nr:hypothetical protein C5167_047010 [Papaver somniferum]
MLMLLPLFQSVDGCIQRKNGSSNLLEYDGEMEQWRQGLLADGAVTDMALLVLCSSLRTFGKNDGLADIKLLQ